MATTNKTAPTKKKGKYANTVERFWDGVPVEDAKNELRIIIKPCDIKDASRKDPGHCVFARACKRSFGTRKILFLRSIAYVELPDEKGDTKVERFFMSESVQQLVRNFDMGDKVIPTGGFLLLPPKPSHQLDSLRVKQALRKKRMREALLRGEISKTEGTKGKESPHKPRMIDLEVRNGTGMVKFS